MHRIGVLQPLRVVAPSFREQKYFLELELEDLQNLSPRLRDEIKRQYCCLELELT